MLASATDGQPSILEQAAGVQGTGVQTMDVDPTADVAPETEHQDAGVVPEAGHQIADAADQSSTMEVEGVHTSDQTTEMNVDAAHDVGETIPSATAEEDASIAAIEEQVLTDPSGADQPPPSA